MATMDRRWGGVEVEKGWAALRSERVGRASKKGSRARQDALGLLFG
jgi:hypothetical protein